jgi:hypothetical protein
MVSYEAAPHAGGSAGRPCHSSDGRRAGPCCDHCAETRQFTADELLAWRDAATLAVPHDVAYGRATSYRAVPLRTLLSALPPDAADTMEARATDGFVSQLPRALIEGSAVPWVAVEDPAHPWPLIPGKTFSAGPFYLVWQNPERAGISPEQWPYALAALTAVASPVQRWPAIAVDASAPADAPARRGQAVFIVNCLPCHRLGGSGEGIVGPDLLRPMPAATFHRRRPARADSQSCRCAQLARTANAGLQRRNPGRLRDQCGHRLFALPGCTPEVRRRCSPRQARRCGQTQNSRPDAMRAPWPVRLRGTEK